MGYTEYEGTAHIKVYNNSTTDNCEVQATREIVSQVFGSVNYFCFGKSCYPATTSKSDEGDLVSIDPQSNDESFVAYYNPENNPGNTRLKYTFENVNNPSDKQELFINFKATSATVGVGELESKVGVSYKASSKKIIVTLENVNANGEIVIKDITGKTVFSDAVSFGTGVLVIPAESFSPGIHIVALQDANGNRIGLPKLSVY